MPETAAGIWAKRYDEVLSGTDEFALDVLKACKLLFDLGYDTYYSNIVWGFYNHVIGGGSRGLGEFLEAVQSLINRQWIDLAGDEVYGPGVEYNLHDTQLEAVAIFEETEHSVPTYSNAISEFLLKNLDESHIPADDNHWELQLNGRLAYLLQRADPAQTQLARKHLDKCKEIDENNSGVYTCTHGFFKMS